MPLVRQELKLKQSTKDTVFPYKMKEQAFASATEVR